MSNERKPRGRPQTWHTKITAPPEALELYALIARLQKSTAFQACHIYHGANLEGVPMVKWDGKSTKLPYIVASYMGLDTSLQQCKTPGCCNPFHYIAPSTTGAALVTTRENPAESMSVGLEEWVELVEWELDRNAMRLETVTFEQVRALIPPEDLLDEQVLSALNYLKEQKE